MQNKKLFSIIILAIMAFSAIAIVTPVFSTNVAIDIDPVIIDDSLRHRIESATPDNNFEEVANQISASGINAKVASSSSASESAIGDQKVFWILDDAAGTYSLSLFTLYSQGTVGEVYVQNNRAYPAGDPRDPSLQDITQAQTDYLLSEFENNIYAKEAGFYGAPGYQNGSDANLGAPYGLPDSATLCLALGVPVSYCDYTDSQGRTAILVENVRDNNYYDPTYPVYIAGFYSSQLDSVFDRNMMTIDSYDWVNRVGPDGNRPFTYEMTFAHEYQHLIHSDYVPGDSSFINEGFSMYAEYLCGYGVDYGYVNAYFAQPHNSLTEWGDLGDINILGDYGESMLFTHYLEGHYDGFQTDYMQNGIPGIAGLEKAVAQTFGPRSHSRFLPTFDQLFNNFHLANLIQDKFGPYSYSTIDFSMANPLTIQSFVDNVASGGSHTYGSNYFVLDNLDGLYKLDFTGDPSSTVYHDPGWTLDADGIWYSGMGDEVDRSLLGSAFVDPSDPTLSFDTDYFIEDYWDFGFVQVSTDSGATWTSLSNSYTTSDHADGAYPAIIDQLPGLTGAYTGTMSFDLSAYAGQTVDISFRYMTDWAYNEYGWYIDSSSVTVSGTHMDLANAPLPPPPTVAWTVTVVSGMHFRFGDVFFNNHNIRVDASTGNGVTLLNFFDTKYTSNFYVVVVTPTMEAGSASFQMNFNSLQFHHH